MSGYEQGFSRILVALDGSESSFGAAETALVLAFNNHLREITVIHVLQVPSFVYYHSAGVTKEIMDKGRSDAESWFSKVKELAKKRQIELKTVIVPALDTVYTEIIGYAEKENVDLIVVGTRGRTGLKRLVLGSVASNVVSYAHCTVMVVRPHRERMATPDSSPESINQTRIA